MMGLIQILLGFLGSPGLRRLKAGLADPKRAQLKLLSQYLREIKSCEYGRAYEVRQDWGVQEFQSKVPLNTYETLAPWIERQKSDGLDRLYSSPVIVYEKTSGSSGPVKFIPYTRRLKKTFSEMALLWITDLCLNGPKLKFGRIFLSISPSFQKMEKTPKGVNIGLEDDAEYLPWIFRLLGSRFWIMPTQLKKLKDPDDYRWVLGCHLLAAEDLEVVSIWNPTYLTALFHFITENKEAMAADLRAGMTQKGGYEFRFKALTPARLQLLSGAQPWRSLWPELKIISAWADAGAAGFAQELQSIFPDTLFQPKGLLATEAPMTLPLVAVNGGVPLVNSVFYEFIDESGHLWLLHEIKPGVKYEIVVTARGGLPRYRTGDQIIVSGIYLGTPLLKFVGRTQAVSDVVGEKINEIFVREKLTQLKELQGAFYFLLPLVRARPPRYALYCDSLLDSAVLARIESFLSEAHHYSYARKLGQLGAVEFRRVAELKRSYYEYYVARGMKLGDIKYSALIYRAEDVAGITQWLENLETKSKV